MCFSPLIHSALGLLVKQSQSLNGEKVAGLSLSMLIVLCLDEGKIKFVWVEKAVTLINWSFYLNWIIWRKKRHRHLQLEGLCKLCIFFDSSLLFISGNISLKDQQQDDICSLINIHYHLKRLSETVHESWNRLVKCRSTRLGDEFLRAFSTSEPFITTKCIKAILDLIPEIKGLHAWHF